MKLFDKIIFWLFIIFMYLYMMESMTLQFTQIYTTRFQIVVFSLFVIEFMYCIVQKSITKLSRNPIKIFGFMSLYFIVFTLMLSLFKPLGALSDYLLIAMTFMSFYFMRLLSTRIKDKMIILGFSIMTVLLIVQYFAMFQMAGGGIVTIRNNAAYCIAIFFPFILCNRNKSVSLILSFFIIAAITVSAKRGGVAGVALGLIVYVLMSWKITVKKISQIIFLLIVFGFCSYLLLDFVNNNAIEFLDRIDKLSQEADNGRIDIINRTLAMFHNSDFINQIIGHGFNATIMDSHPSYSAHNDYIEILYDFGVLGLLIYILFTLQLIKLGIQMVKDRAQYAPALISGLILFLTLSNVSHIFLYPSMAIPMYLFFGFISVTYTQSSKILP